MNKKIQIFKLIIPAVVLLGMVFASCMQDYNKCNCSGDSMVSLGVIDTTGTGVNDYVIHLDDGNNVSPLSTSVQSFTAKNNERVLVNFISLKNEKLTDSTLTYFAKIDGLRDILFKGIKKYTEVADDSMGHDPIIIRQAWISKTGGILNIDLKYFTQGSVHYINLIDNGEANGIDNPFVLVLRHNARGDQPNYPAAGLVSFKLDYLKLPGKNATNFVIRFTDYQGRQIDIPETYKY